MTGCTLVEMTLGDVMVTLTCRPLFSLLGRFTQSLESEPADCQSPSQLCPSPAESSLSSVPSESPDTFSGLHSSLAPAVASQSPSGSPRGSIEDLSSAGSSPTMSDKRRKAPTPPSYTSYGTPNGVPVREPTSPTSVEIDEPLPGRKLSLPLPDYDTLFPQKRHGVQGQTRWDHIIAEVTQKNRDYAEMSVDGPEEHQPGRRRSSVHQESPAVTHHQTQPQETKPVSSKKFAAPAPPKSVTPPYLRSAADFFQLSGRDSLSAMSRDGARKAILPPAATHNTPRLISQKDLDTTKPDDRREVTVNNDAPTARPRQRASVKEPAQQEDSAVTPDRPMNSYVETSSMIGTEAKENLDFDPFPSTELLSNDPWAQLKHNKEADDFFTGGVQKEQKAEDRGMTPDDLDSIFGQEKQTDPFADFNGKDSEYMKKDEDSKQDSPVIQKRNSQRRKLMMSSTTPSDITTSKSRQEPETTITTAYKGLSARGARNEPITPKPPADVKTQSNFYGGEDQFGAEPFTSTVTFSEPLQVVIEEADPAPPAGGLSGGKASLRAWVSPSDVVSAQSSNGGGLAFTPRR